MESLDVGFGVDLMVLSALATEPLLPAQTAFAKSEGRGTPRAANRSPGEPAERRRRAPARPLRQPHS